MSITPSPHAPSRCRTDRTSRLAVEACDRDTAALVHELQHEMAQVLSGLKCHLEIIRRSPDPVATAQAAQAGALVDRLVAWLRDMAVRVRPPMLDDLGLGPTLTWVAHDLQRRTGKPVTLRQEGLEPRVDPLAESVVFSAVREVVGDALATAAAVSAHVEVTADAEGLQSMIALSLDESAGGAEADVPITDRVRQPVACLGGTVRTSRSPSMARIDVWVPFASEMEEAER